METFETNPSVRQIKELTFDTRFNFQRVLPWETYQTVMELNKNNAKSGNIATKALKMIARDICLLLTDCINSAILTLICMKYFSQLSYMKWVPGNTQKEMLN